MKKRKQNILLPLKSLLRELLLTILPSAHQQRCQSQEAEGCHTAEQNQLEIVTGLGVGGICPSGALFDEGGCYRYVSSGHAEDIRIIIDRSSSMGSSDSVISGAFVSSVISAASVVSGSEGAVVS